MYSKRSDKHQLSEIITLLILLICAAISIIYRHPEHAKTTSAYEIYTVRAGDTLWSISTQYVNGDPRELVHEIEKLNSITPIITPGQEIKIPIWEVR